jgi:diamine N-acetyltransferase
LDLLENENVRLRALEPEDLDLLYQWENDPSVWLLSGTLIPFSKYVLRQYLQNAGKDLYEARQLRLVIEVKAESRAIGAIDLFEFDPYHRRAGIGILIAARPDRGKGYAREALEILKEYCFSTLKLKQIWCNIAAGNQRSMKLFTSAGFEVVGEKKAWLFTGDGYESEYLLQCIKM